MTEKLILEATIPTVQYGNVKPTIEMEGEDFEQLRDEGLKRIKSISDMVAGEGFTFDVRGLPVEGGRTIESVAMKALESLTSRLTGTKLFFDKDNHIYTDKDGNKYSSASAFPAKFFTPFERDIVLEAIVKKHGGKVNGKEILDMWQLNSEASTGYGTAIHAALENFDRNRNLGEVLRSDNKDGSKGPNKSLSKNPFLQAVVNWFHEGRDREDVLVEEFVSDNEFKICGRIDRLKIIDREKKIVRVQDYKTHGDIHETKYQIKDSPFKQNKEKTNKNAVENTLLGYHRLQLSFLAFILQRAGYTVEGLDIFWLNPAKLVKGENPWETFSSKVIDISEALVNG